MIWLFSTLASAATVDVCDGIDNDGDGQVDEDAVYADRWMDHDEDGFGAGQRWTICLDDVGGDDLVPDNLVDNDLDCNDFNANISPDAPEVCDALDNDCSGVVDDDLEYLELFQDLDRDGFGAGTASYDCQVTGAFTTVSGDCDDDDPEIHPDADDLCDDGIDDDCDGADALCAVDTGVPSSSETGCGCDSSGSSAAWMLGLVLLIRRRARGPAASA